MVKKVGSGAFGEIYKGKKYYPHFQSIFSFININMQLAYLYFRSEFEYWRRCCHQACMDFLDLNSLGANHDQVPSTLLRSKALQGF